MERTSGGGRGTAYHPVKNLLGLVFSFKLHSAYFKKEAEVERVLIVDLFGVFLRFCHMAHDESVLARCSASRAKVKEFFEGPAWCGYECGTLNDIGFIEALQKELGYEGTIEDFGERFFRSVTLDRKFYDFFQEFRVKEHAWGRVLLTNICPVFYRLANRRHPGIFSSFEKIILSYEVGFRKPDPRIFAKAIAEKKNKDIYVFIDDVAENVAAAEAAGIRSVLFRPEMVETGELYVRLANFGMANI